MEFLKPSPDADLLTDTGNGSHLKVAVLSGKGGVGKTTLCANLAVSIASRGTRVLLMDCDLSAGQAHLLLGLAPSMGLAHVVRGEKTLKQVCIDAGKGLSVAPGGPNGGRGLEIERIHLESLMGEARLFFSPPGIVIMDAGPSRIASASGFAVAADLTIAVSTPDPASIRSTVALVESLCCDCPGVRPWILINMASGHDEAKTTYERMERALVPLFGDAPHFFGAVPYDKALRKSVRQSVPLASAALESPALLSLRGLAGSLMRIQTDLEAPGAITDNASQGEDLGEGGPEDSEAGLHPPGGEGLDDPEKADDDEGDGGHARAA